MQQEDEDLTISDEWKYIALIIDHLLLYIYCFFAFFGTFHFFWNIGEF
jgi:nicotinic acetylcholine receptor beta-2